MTTDEPGTARRKALSPLTAASRPGDVPDTEQLRLLMHRYRDLFNHICQP